MSARVASWFATLTHRQRWALAFACALVLGNLALHRSIERVCDALSDRHGFPTFNRAALWGLVLASGAGLLVVAIRLRSRPRSWSSWAIVALLGTLTWVSHRLLIMANVELVHFPQFGLLAGALLAAGFRVRSAWALASLAGVIDEIYQRLSVYAGKSWAYLDYNDMVLNAIGAAWAVMLVAFSRDGTSVGITDRSRPDGKTKARLWAAVGVGVALYVFLILFDLFYLGSMTDTPTFGREYRRILPGEGALLFGLVWGLVWLLPNRHPPDHSAGGQRRDVRL